MLEDHHWIQIPRASLLLTCVLFGGGCLPDDGATATEEATTAAIASENGLSAINGLTSTNGLMSMNGLTSTNGLMSTNGLATSQGLSSTVGLMTTAAGRQTVSYLVKCALPAGHTLVKADQYGTSYSFPGSLGLAPGWENGAPTQTDRYLVSSCLLAHVNTSGKHLPLWLVGPSLVGWGRNNSYPVQEGSFVGDLFTSPPTARYCGGRGYGSNVVAGRIGDQGQAGVPYAIISDGNGETRCDRLCTRDSSNDGFTSCPVPGIPITVWRPFASAPAVSFESSLNGFVASTASQPTSLLLSGAQHMSGTNSMLMVVSAGGIGQGRADAPADTVIRPGKNMTLFVKVPLGTRWDYIIAFAQESPATGYKWHARAYYRNELLPTEWASLVVPIPANFALKGSRFGIQIQTNGADMIKVYVDSIFFDS